jgi:hypothetical protein
MVLEGPLCCSYELATSRYPDPDDFSPKYPTLFPKEPFRYKYPKYA